MSLKGVAPVHELLRRHGRLDARHERGREPYRREAHAARRPGAHHHLLRAGRRVELHRRDRRPAGRLGPGQRALHRHRAVGDHRLGRRRGRGRRDPLRGRPRPGHRRRPAARRRARGDQLARAVLQRRRADDDRPHRHRGVPRQDAEATARARVGPRPAARAAPPRGPGHRPDRRLLQLRLLHPAGLHAVGAGPRRARARLRVLRLGPHARGLRRLRHPDAVAPDRRRPRPRLAPLAFHGAARR